MFHFGTDHTNQERRDGFVSFRCFLGSEEEEGRGRERESGRRGEDLERTEEELEDGNGTWRGRERDFEKGETRLSIGQNQDFEKVKTNSGFFVKCNFGSQHSQHSQQIPPKPLRMRKLMGG